MYKSWQLQDIEPLPGPGQSRVLKPNTRRAQTYPTEEGFEMIIFDSKVWREVMRPWFCREVW